MAYEFYVTIQGSRQGKFKGESTSKDHPNKLVGLMFNLHVKSPIDHSSGLRSGAPVYEAVSFVKEWGVATPQIIQALTVNETLTSVLFEFVRTDERWAKRFSDDQANQCHHRGRPRLQAVCSRWNSRSSCCCLHNRELARCRARANGGGASGLRPD